MPRFSAILSVCCGLLVFFGFVADGRRRAGAAGAKEGWAVLAVEESCSDRLIRESLERGGFTGLISESSQKVPVDDFGAFKMVALDSFHREIEAFDPRDTGFAAKLRAFFVQGGKRFFFLPLENPSPFKAAMLEKKLSRLLGDIPFSLSVLGRGSAVFLHFALLAAACLGALFFSRAKRLFIYPLPALLAFSGCGAFSFILAALLAGIWELLREPLGELYAARRYERQAFDYAGPGVRGLKERLKPFRANCVLAAAFALLFAGFAIAGELAPVPLAAGCGGFFFLYRLAFKAETARARKNAHTLFAPVPLLPLKSRTFSLFPLLLPFGAVSALVLALPLSFQAFSSREMPVNPRGLISSADYERYIAFQRSFSYTPLERDPAGNPAENPAREALNQKGYLRYYLGEDGLIEGGSAGFPDGKGSAPPPFPLEKLMRFLIDYSSPAKEASLAGAESQAFGQADAGAAYASGGAKKAAGLLFEVKELMSMAIIFTASALNLLQPGARNKKNRKDPVLGDKRIAA